MKIEKHIEKIECPNCGTRQKAEVLYKYTSPYIHKCVSCHYIITESEWVLIATEDEMELEASNDEDE